MSRAPFEIALRTLARRCGLQTSYRDGMHVEREVSASTLQAVMASMGIPVATSRDVRQAMAELAAREWRKIVAPVIVPPDATRGSSLLLSVPCDPVSLDTLVVEGVLQNEAGATHTFRSRGRACRVRDVCVIERQRYCRVGIPFPPCEAPGYYTLHVRVSTGGRALEGEALVIVPPPQCYMPSASRRMWGITLQLAALRSSTNWGCGDFRDLQQVACWAGKHGADTVGVNPLHVGVPGVVSPYSPSSRLFTDPVYVDVTAVPEFRASETIRRRIGRPPLRRALCSLREQDVVDYEAVRTIKRKVFEQLYREFAARHLERNTRRARAFFQFVDAGGRNLRRFAIFQVLSERFHSSSWRRWPPGYRHPDSPEVARFVKGHEAQIRFHQYLQWVCEQQLHAVNCATQRAGLRLGLYHDLPVGIHPDGADAWIFQSQLARGMTIGAPPDAFNLHGQNWGLVPPNPLELRAHGYDLFVETVRRNMRHGGVLRIDHALGLFRSFWIPERAPTTSGVYVRYPVDELLAIVALESFRARVMVVGEDLGTVTPRIRTRLAQSGMLSYRLLLFERTATGRFRRPSSFPSQALVAVTTHDLPTIRGFWIGRDIDVKEQLGVYPEPHMARDARDGRARDRTALLEALRREGLLPADDARDAGPEMLTDELCEAIHRYLARTPSRLMMITIEDLIGELEAPNVPGVPSEAYPSWRRKLSRLSERWMTESGVRRLLAAVDRERAAESFPGSSRESTRSARRVSVPRSSGIQGAP